MGQSQSQCSGFSKEMRKNQTTGDAPGPEMRVYDVGTRRPMTEDNPAYRSHGVFPALDRYADFYEKLAMSIIGFVTAGTDAFINIDTYMYQSMGGTLNSIRTILYEGRINDGYALVRKYFDSVMLSLYVDLYLNDRLDEGVSRVDQVNDWLRGKKALPEYKSMKTYVTDAARLKPVIGMLLKSDHRYKAIRDRTNGHMHYSDFQSMLLNDRDVRAKRLRVLDEIESDVADLFVLHLACVFFMNGHYMMSSDYVDYLECGMKPEVDSQYWVAPFVHEIFDNVLSVRRPDVCAVIRSQTFMHLEQ